MKPLFTIRLLKWNETFNLRTMPWKGEKDAYRIWLSEIILQQTRVDQGLAYYNAFVSAFPTVHELANASEQEIFKRWEGLGYYSRCKNLIATAKFISQQLDGQFPTTYNELRALKGVGPYTAAAIASFAFNQPHAVVDGNVVRVIARYLGITTPIANLPGKQLFNMLAEALMDKNSPAQYNQAIMDFGAIICKPQLPLCEVCFQKKDCEAFNNNWVNLLPVKEKKAQRRTRYFYYFMIECRQQVYIKKRSGKDIWQNLYEFVLKETDAPAGNAAEMIQHELGAMLGEISVEVIEISALYRQQLTHQIITGCFIHVKTHEPCLSLKGYERVDIAELSKYPFPRSITAWLEKKPFYNKL